MPPFQSYLLKPCVCAQTLSVDSSVIKVHAEDADLTSQNNRLTYSIMPPVPSAFMVRSDGTIILKTRLNYNTANHYNFTVEARTGQFLSIMPEAIEAKDGDTGINQPIVYSISAVSPSKYTSHFNINPVSGIITVVTQLDREEVGMVTVHIKVMIQDSASSDVVVISLNQPVNIVDREILEMERSLGQALGWTVKVISVRSANSFGGGVRSSRDSAKTYVTFIAMDAGNTMVPSEEVERKLESESEAVQIQLEKVFGEGLEYTVENGPVLPDHPDQTIAIVCVLLAIVGLVVMAVVTSVKLKTAKSRNKDSIAITGIDHPSQQHR
ncbi:hypothetical protein AAFF_G00408510 [Aldrovandia affinis]|uniref:Cadherin domain-containing protein n=1 Tax=Aldrovandia affinis TaxID=143900 RepID=A0AAD7WJW8_9TELE|nr:hypothetical protein AAFF_G00408510 [Aldrovandia affinis]